MLHLAKQNSTTNMHLALNTRFVTMYYMCRFLKRFLLETVLPCCSIFEPLLLDFWCIVLVYYAYKLFFPRLYDLYVLFYYLCCI